MIKEIISPKSRYNFGICRLNAELTYDRDISARRGRRSLES